jgi:hypothetical protein
LRRPKEVSAALRILVDASVLVEQQLKTGGRPRSAYVTNPRIWS